ncbi:MAG: GntR family transcriptional regulator [Caldilineaceae bacterium]|nr:GntR family transcriptional regulator [Caldilineaceae bacterium]
MSIGDFPPVRARTLRDEVANRLREAIRSGSLPAGTRLVEQEMAERLGVSRVPVREAIQALVEEGLVRKSPHRGAYVYLPTRDEIDEISSLRVVLERFVVERVIQNWNESHESALRAIVARMRTAMQKGDYQHVYEQDYAFHLMLWEIANHAILLEIVSSLRSRISRFLYEATTALPKEPANTHVDSHDDLIDILKSGDIEAAHAEIARHILAAKERILTYCMLEPPRADGQVDAGK